jgi:hypothetical protein
VLDGLEVVQEGPAGDGFGRLLDGTLREVLTGACQQPHSGLVILTSRFPFADLEAFEGSSARMLEVPPFTPAEGSELLAVAGGWLADGERRDLVRAVNGHALTTRVLAVLLAARPPTTDLATLHNQLSAAARTDVRVGRVLEFYAGRLSDPERYLLAAVSLFSRPVDATAVLAVARHNAFGGRLAGWTPAMMQAAVRERLGGLATWHPDGTISAHPLVHDTFRRLVMDATDAAAEVALTGIPAGRVVSRAGALRVVESIELLLGAGHWKSADDMFRDRGGKAWLDLPAIRLGQRAATAFVATPDRRAACASRLPEQALGFYLNEAGLFASYAGDLATGSQYLTMAVRRDRNDGVLGSVASSSNLAECFCHMGQTDPAEKAAVQALAHAENALVQIKKNSRDWSIARYHGRVLSEIRDLHISLAYIAALIGNTSEADQQFAAADQIEVANDKQGDHLYAGRGALWAEWLGRTGRPGPALALTRRNIEICRDNGWNGDRARCDRVLGRLALAAADTAAAGECLAAAAECFRDGDFLTELAPTLTDLAEHARGTGDLDTAEHHATEAITIAAPRGMIPAHSAALSARARIRVDQAAASRNLDLLVQGRDAAGAALRLAVLHQMAWHEFDALRAHALLDRAEDADHGWATQADALYERLVPPDLDPDPLATIERLVADKKSR